MSLGIHLFIEFADAKEKINKPRLGILVVPGDHPSLRENFLERLFTEDY